MIANENRQPSVEGDRDRRETGLMERLGNRSLERVARLADEARDAFPAQPAPAAAPVTQNITINAQHLSVEQLVDELDRRKRQAQAGSLFDGAADYGQYGEAS